MNFRSLRAGESTVTGFVKYDPVAAKHITDKKLLSISQLNSLLSSGATEVPTFPVAAVSLKPVFTTISASQLVDGRYFLLPAWPGPPTTPQPFPPNDWKQFVWVNIKATGDGTGTGKVDTVGKADGSSRTPQTTYGVNRFIHFRLSAAQAQALNALNDAVPAGRAPRTRGGGFLGAPGDAHDEPRDHPMDLADVLVDARPGRPSCPQLEGDRVPSTRRTQRGPA